jgi:hypothetical protein
MVTGIASEAMISASTWPGPTKAIDPHEMPAVQLAITNTTAYDGTDECDPAGDDRTDLPAAAPLVAIRSRDGEKSQIPDAGLKAITWAPEKKEIEATAKKPVTLALRLLNYPAWQVTLNGKSNATSSSQNTEQMLIPVECGAARIEIQFVRTLDHTIGIMLSACSAVILPMLVLVGRLGG